MNKGPKKEPVYQGYISLSTKYSVSYCKEITGFFYNRRGNRPPSNKPKAVLSSKAAKRIKNIFQWLIASSSIKKVYSKMEKKNFYFRLNFITLTLSMPQHHSDEFIKSEMLEKFIQWCKRKHGVISYLWKAETQGNGNIHFHITTNKFIHWRDVRIKWNQIQKEYGYLKDSINPEAIQNTNSTDIHAIKKEDKIIGYMIKYFTMDKQRKKYVSLSCQVTSNKYIQASYNWFKDTEGCIYEHNRQVSGRTWAASNNLLSSSLTMESGTKCYDDIIEWIKYYQNAPIISKDFCNITPLKQYSSNELPLSVKAKYTELINAINKKDNKVTYYQVDTLF